MVRTASAYVWALNNTYLKPDRKEMAVLSGAHGSLPPYCFVGKSRNTESKMPPISVGKKP